jgi:hypothetical protein
MAASFSPDRAIIPIANGAIIGAVLHSAGMVNTASFLSCPVVGYPLFPMVNNLISYKISR